MVVLAGLFLPFGADASAQDLPANGANAYAAPAASGETYTLGVGDKLRVTVFGEDDLSGEFEVDSGGFVRLPLIGQVQAAGMTLSKFESDVEA